MATVATRTLVCPAYFSNSGGGAAYWTALNAAARRCRLIAIANPSNGPGGSADSNYTNALNALIAAGGIPIGYVYCGNGTRDAATVDADIDSWHSFYPMIKGIFTDENYDSTGSKLTYFEARYNKARATIANAVTIGNPGSYSLHESYLTSASKADMYCTWENDAGVAITYPSYIASYSKFNFCNLQYSQPTEAGMNASIIKAGPKVGNFYVQSDDIWNPWDTVPAYLQAMAALIGGARHGVCF